VVGTQKHVPVQFFADELTLSLDDFSSRILKPAMSVLASNIAASVGTAMAAGFVNQVGTAGTTPSSFLTFAQAGEMLDWQTAPEDGNRTALVNPTVMAALADAQKGLFHSANQIEGAFEDGVIDMMTGLKFKKEQSLPTITNGARASYTTHGTTVHTSGTAVIAVITGTGTMKAGETFTLAGIYEVNPDTKVSTGRLKIFTIATDYAGGAGNITVSQIIWTSGAYQNVSAALPTTTALTFTGSASTAYTRNFVFYRDAVTLATADLEIPKGVDMAYRANMDGLSLRFIRDYDVTTDNFIGRFDILYGIKVVRPEWGVHVLGA
jgi:P22 coat protein - gene protein 5